MISQCYHGFPALSIRVVPMARVIVFHAVRLTFGAIFKWIFSKLPASNLGVGIARDCWGQVAEMFLNFDFLFEYPGMFLNFTECF